MTLASSSQRFIPNALMVTCHSSASCAVTEPYDVKYRHSAVHLVHGTSLGTSSALSQVVRCTQLAQLWLGAPHLVQD